MECTANSGFFFFLVSVQFRWVVPLHVKGNRMASAAIHSLIEALDAKGLEAYLSENDVDLDEVRFDNGNCPLQKAAELGA
jgi:hypothetical protein